MITPPTHDPLYHLFNTFEEHAKKESWWRGKAIIYYDKTHEQLKVKYLNFWQKLAWKLGWRSHSHHRDYKLENIMKEVSDRTEEVNNRTTRQNPLFRLNGMHLLAQRYLNYVQKDSTRDSYWAFAQDILSKKKNS